MGEDLKGFFAGSLAGCAGLIVSHPIDTVRIRIQTQGAKYSGTINCFLDIMKNEKFRGYFKGMTYPLLGQSAINATVFGVEAMVYSRLQSNDDNQLNTKNSIIAGLCAGSVQTVIVCPIELVKIRMQNQSIGQQHESWTMKKLGMSTKGTSFQYYRGPLQTTLDIISKEGIRGMFRGWWLTYFREVPQFGIYFGTYAWIRVKFASMMNISPQELGVFHLSLAGGITGVITWCWYPVDVIKSRYQNDGSLREGKKYNGVIDCIRKSVQNEGMGVFVKGLQPTLIRGFFNGFATFPVFVITMQLLNGKYV